MRLHSKGNFSLQGEKINNVDYTTATVINEPVPISSMSRDDPIVAAKAGTLIFKFSSAHASIVTVDKAC